MRFKIVNASDIYPWDVIVGWSINAGRTFEMTSEPVTVTAITETMIFGSMDGAGFQKSLTPDVRLLEKID